MAVQALSALQGNYSLEAHCVLEIWLAQGSELETLKNYGTVLNSQSTPCDHDVHNSIVQSQEKECSETKKVQQVLNNATTMNGMKDVTGKQQSQLGEKNGRSTEHGYSWEQIKERISNYLEKSKKRELEAQRKREEEELQKELEHFLYHAFDLFEEETTCETDVVDLHTADVLSSLKEVICDGKMSLCHFNFGKWVKQISEEQEKILLKGIVDLSLLGAVDLDADEALMSRAEESGISHWDFRETSRHDFKLSDTSEKIPQLEAKQWNILSLLSTTERRKDIAHITFSKHFPSWGLFLLLEYCTTDPTTILCWHLGEQENGVVALALLLQPNTNGVRLIVPWDPGNQGSKTRNKLLLLYRTTNVKLLLPWDPGEHENIVEFINSSKDRNLRELIMLTVTWHFLKLEEFKGSGDHTGKCIQMVPRDALHSVQSLLFIWYYNILQSSIRVLEIAAELSYQLQPAQSNYILILPAEPPEQSKCASFISRRAKDLSLDISLSSLRNCIHMVIALSQPRSKGATEPKYEFTTTATTSSIPVRNFRNFLGKCFSKTMYPINKLWMLEVFGNYPCTQLAERHTNHCENLYRSVFQLERVEKFLNYIECPVLSTLNDQTQRSRNSFVWRFSFDQRSYLQWDPGIKALLGMHLSVGACKCCSDRDVPMLEVKLDYSLVALEWFATSSVGQFFLFHCMSHLAKAIVCIRINHPAYRAEMVKSLNEGNLSGALNIICEHLLHDIINLLATENMIELDDLI